MRSFADYQRNLGKIHLYAWYVVRVFLLFRRPWRFLRHYLARTSPEERLVELRSGLKIFLSSHPHDIVTVFVIFVRGDYGKVPPSATVIDIGANIGIFALYAATRGARLVHAYEPNQAAFDCLVRNVQENSLDGIIRPHRLAVADLPGKLVKFPAAPSAYNRIARDDADGALEVVETTNLKRILEGFNDERVDLLKLDCEGAEYEILMNPAGASLAGINALRMEYHDGRVDDLVNFLRRQGFRITLLRPDSASTGSLWAESTSLWM